ncbi:MAG: N-6 DNA methylase, partial [Methylococcaceae bacterium]
MPLFNKKVIEQALIVQEIPSAHLEILCDWQAMIVSKELVKHKETAVSISFVSKFLETILGYKTLGSGKNYSLAQEYPIAKGSVDTALGEFFNDKQGDKVHAVFELKGAKAKNLDNLISGRNETPIQQGWRYARDAEGCQWILVTNYLEIRLYSYNETTLVYETFDLAKLTDPTEYAKFVLCLHADNLLAGKTKALLAQSKQVEKDITEKLYDDYKNLRELLITRFIEDNPDVEPLDLISPAQKLLDRILFIAFCEDKGLLPSKTIEQAYKYVEIYNPRPIYQNFKGLFQAINKGNEFLKVPAYNGGLFASDKLLDKLIVADELCKGFLKIADYDFASEISVTVLGHIFEQSIADLEEITAQIKNGERFQKTAKTTAVSGKRKQHGIVYTPDHITAFIVEHTLGEHLKQRFSDCLTPFGSVKDDGEIQWNKAKDSELKFWYEWQSTLKTIKIVDPACGSGAFLVAAFDVLHFEYQKANNRIAEITEHGDIFDLNKEILNSNLFGVDLNSESVEITKLSLWLKTAERGKKLTTIDKYIQVGNSLGFDSPTFEGGFCWQNNFSKIMKSGGFDVVLGNPPYVRQELLSDVKPYLQKNYAVYHGVADLYAYFFELGLKLLKPNGLLGFISSATFFKTGSGEPLRRYLQTNATLQKVIDFGDLQVFEGVTTYPAILIFQNAKPVDDSQIQMLVLTKELPEKLGEFFAENHGIMAHSQLKNESWQFEDARLSQLRDKLTNGFPTLKDVYGSPYRGVLTGLNEAFVIDGETKKRLISQDPNSAELLKPFLEGKDLKKWHSQPRDLW